MTPSLVTDLTCLLLPVISMMSVYTSDTREVVEASRASRSLWKGSIPWLPNWRHNIQCPWQELVVGRIVNFRIKSPSSGWLHASYCSPWANLNHSYSVPEVKLHLESLQLDPCLESGVLQIEEGFLKFQIQSAIVVVLLIARAFQGGIHILEV